MHDITGFKRDVLYVIAGLGEPKGLAIHSELESYYGTDINHGRMYQNLDQLVEMGLIEKGKKDERTNAYTLTADAERLLESRRQWEDRYLSDRAEVATS